MTSQSPVPKAGDIITAFTPTFYDREKPGARARLCVVLGVEVDETAGKIEGLWLVRLSRRVHKVREWDYVLEARDYILANQAENRRDFVVRTPTVFLLPASPDYIDNMTPVGRVRPTFWPFFAPQLDAGQHCYMADNDYGPRPQLPHTVAKAHLQSRHAMSFFDYRRFMNAFAGTDLYKLPEKKADMDPYDLALAQANRQKSAHSRILHKPFVAAIQAEQETTEFAETDAGTRADMALKPF